MSTAGDNQTVERQATPGGAARIVVAIDTSRQSLSALEEAAALAAHLQAELEGLFVEDINLLHLCGFPFCNQIGSYTARPRRMDNRALERELRVMAERLRRETERIARRVQVPWRFQVRRGAVVNELLNAAQSATFLGLGRGTEGAARRRALGSTARAVLAQATRPVLVLGESSQTQPPLIVIYTADDAGRRALDLALRLAPRYNHHLQIWLAAPYEEGEGAPSAPGNRTAQETHQRQLAIFSSLQAELEERKRAYDATQGAPLNAEIVPLDPQTSLRAKLRSPEPYPGLSVRQHTVIVPNSQVDLLTHHTGPAILVP